MAEPSTLLLPAALGVHDLGLLAATILVLNATPGVDLLLTLGTTLRQGVRAGLAVAAGISAGCLVHTLGAAFGLAALMATSAAAFGVVKWAGAAYLLWLALGMAREALSVWREGRAGSGTAADAEDRRTGLRKGEPEDGHGYAHEDGHGDGHSVRPTDQPADDPGRAPGTAALFRRGLLTNALNPKVAMFFLALLPQFIDAAAPHKTLSFLFLGAWFIVQSAVFLAAFVLLVAPLRRWQPGRAVRAGLQAAGGALFALLAGRLALAER